jgi:hypothetical protein
VLLLGPDYPSFESRHDAAPITPQYAAFSTYKAAGFARGEKININHAVARSSMPEPEPSEKKRETAGPSRPDQLTNAIFRARLDLEQLRRGANALSIQSAEARLRMLLRAQENAQALKMKRRPK